MENLTKSLGVAKLFEGLAPMEGHKVVIFREDKGGIFFERILDPQDQPIKKGFFKKPNYFAYTVSMEPSLNYEFSNQILVDHIHDFTLHNVVYFRVTDPKIITIRIDRDPLKLIKEEIGRIFKKTLKKHFSWEEIMGDFEEVAAVLKSDTNMQRISNYASQYGVMIKEIELDYSVPEKIVEPDIVKEDAERKRKIDIVKQEEEESKRRREVTTRQHENQLRYLQIASDTKAELAHRVVDAVDRLVQQINSPESFKKAAASVRDAVNLFFQYTPHVTDTDYAQIAPENQEQRFLPPEASAAFNEPHNLMLKLSSSIESSSCEPDLKKKFRSHITHLQAELYLEENADYKIIKGYLEQLKTFFTDSRKILPHDSLTIFKQIKTEISRIESEYRAR